MATVAYDEVTSLRRKVNGVSADPSLSAAEKQELLQSYREDLTDLLGEVDSLMGDERLVSDVDEANAAVRRQKARSDADLRESLLARGWATEEQLDELGLLEHGALDELAERGELDGTLAGLEEASLGGLVTRAGTAIKFDPHLHPRDRRGKFRDVLGKLESGQSAELPDGTKVTKHDKGFDVEGGGSKVTVAGAHSAATEALNRSAKSTDPGSLGGATSYKSLRHFEGSQGEAPPEGFQEKFNAQAAEVNKRVEQGMEAGLSSLSPAELHFNMAGHVSQRSLLEFADAALTQPSTADKYARKVAGSSYIDAEYEWDDSRRQLHERIIGAYLKKRKWDPEAKGGKGDYVLDFDPEAEDLPSQDAPQVVFSGGGYAAGKGGSLKILAARGEMPEDSFVLDPDQIKALLPEYEEALKKGDPQANLLVYREAWAIAQEIQARAQEKKLNIVVDGISDTSPDEMLQRWDAFRAMGYTGRAVYTDIPTEEAMRRAAHRAQNAENDSDRRMIPDVIMRAVHRDVAATVPALAQEVAARNDGLSIEVYDNNQGKDELGNFRPPKLFYSVADGKAQAQDEGLWAAFKRKGFEQIPGVGIQRPPAGGGSPPFGQGTQAPEDPATK